MLISLVVHVEEGKLAGPERYRQVAAGLRSLGKVFRKHDARINLDVEPGFVTAALEAGDTLLPELGVGDAVQNGIDVMLCFFSILAPEVTAGSPFDHETIPWNRAERMHPWRVGSTSTSPRHDPAGKVIYIPGDSIDQLEKLHERYLTGWWNRSLDRIQPPPALDERDLGPGTGCHAPSATVSALSKFLTFRDPRNQSSTLI